jgi:hypothetical protein
MNPKFKLPDKPENQKYGKIKQASASILSTTSILLEYI